MRNKNRIPLILTIFDQKNLWKVFIADNTDLNETDIQVLTAASMIKNNLNKLRKYWLESPDLRLGQSLINLGYVKIKPDMLLYNVEEDDWLIEEGYCKTEDIKFWGRNYDESGKRLAKTEYILLRDISDDHVSAILSYFSMTPGKPHPVYKAYFESRQKAILKKKDEFAHIYVDHGGES